MSRRARFQAIFLIGGSLLGVFVAEAALRISNIWIGRHSDHMFMIMDFDEQLGWKMKPSISATIDIVDAENVPVRSNSSGFWDDDFVDEKATGVCRIAFLGDSMTWGLGVHEEERFSNLLAESNPGWDTLNLGISGYGTDQALLAWRNVARRYRPDVVILTAYRNDYDDNMSAVSSGRRKPWFELENGGALALRATPVDPTVFWDDGVFQQAAPPYAELMEGRIEERSRIAHWLVKNSDLVRAAYSAYRVISTGRPPGKDEPMQKKPAPAVAADPTPLDELQVELLGRLVQQIDREVTEAGSRFAVVFAGPPVARFERQQERLRRAGIPYLDATTWILFDRGKNVEPVRAGSVPVRSDGYFAFSWHWNERGHRIVAMLLDEFIQDQGLCGSRGMAEAS